MNNKRKTKAKAAGLKSVFFDQKQAVLTTFAKGNNSQIEKKVVNSEVKDLRQPPAFDLELKEKTFYISGKNNINTSRENPLASASLPLSKRQRIRAERIKRAREENRPYHNVKRVGEDDLRAKADLEKHYFGKEYSDNLKIQIIYNILDINKIISPYINDIVYSMNNLARNDEYIDGKIDVIGSLSSTTDYSSFMSPNKDLEKEKKFSFHRENYKKFVEASKPYMRYYGKVFIRDVKKSKLSTGKGEKIEVMYRSDEEIFTIFQILSYVRQSIMHNDIGNKSSILAIEKYPARFVGFLSDLLKTKTNDVNRMFIDNNSQTNFWVLFSIFGLQDHTSGADKICRNFYDFVIKADSKNLGFSLKKIRELMLDLPNANMLRDHQFDTVRSKFYTLLDFIIYQHYLEEKSRIDNMVEKLRMTLKEEEKEVLYAAEAKIVWNAIGAKVINKLVPMMNGDALKEIKRKNRDRKLPQSVIATVQVNSDANVFSGLIYFLTLFLDGKEINEMVSNLITKFENIDSLLHVDREIYKSDEKDLDLEIEKLALFFKGVVRPNAKTDTGAGEISKSFSIFQSAERIIEELKFIKNVTRMDNEIFPSEGVFLDAANVLGVRGDDFDFSNEFVGDDLHSDANKKIINKINGTKEDRNLRNFIINNVVKSRRFQYIARHMNTRYVKQLANNETLNRFVLNKMGDAKIINRYYESISGNTPNIEVRSQIDYLVKRLRSFSFEDLNDVKQKVRPGTNESIEKEKKKALVGLCLTIQYLVYKNLVNINARYTTAFYCLERDSKLKGFGVDVWRDFESYTALTNHFIKEGYLPVRKAEILRANLKHLDCEDGFKYYRNQVTHLNAIRVAYKYINEIKSVHSYFALYHYIMQRHLYDSLQAKAKDSSGFVIDALKKSFEHKIYSKDLLHVLHSPFGYNTARYKNLSIEALFDKNESRPEVNPLSTND